MSVRHIVRRGAALAATGAAIAAGVAVATTGTAAAQPIPSLQILGNHIVPIPFGPCHGVIRVDHNHVPGRPDLDAITFVPSGTFGVIPGCEVTVAAAWLNGVLPFSHGQGTVVANGPTTMTVPAGQGVSLMVTIGIDPLGRPTWSNSGYLWLQP